MKIPAGVDHGAHLRLGGQGGAGSRGGPPGDLYVSLRVKPHPIFERDGNNIICEVPISFAQAALGGRVIVPTLNGKVKLTIPPRTQTNKIFRLRSKGVPYLHSPNRGDQWVKVMVETPVHLSEEQKELLRKFDELRQGNEQPRMKDFFSKVKRLFGS